MLPESCKSLLIASIKDREYNVRGMALYARAMREDEPREHDQNDKPAKDQPVIVTVSFEDTDDSTRYMSDLVAMDEYGVGIFGRRKITTVMMKVSCSDMVINGKKTNCRIISEAIYNTVKLHVRRKWNGILKDYYAGLDIKLDEMERELPLFSQDERRSTRVWRFYISHQDTWKMLEDNEEVGKPVKGIEFKTFNESEEATSDEFLLVLKPQEV